MKNVIFVIIAMTFAIGCSSQNTSTSAKPEKSQRGGAPNFSELLTQMDSDKDGRLAKNEVKGPLLNDFSKIDTDDDGYITMEELENAPKPQRGQRPPRNN